MAPSSSLSEDLPRLAAEAFELSRDRCVGCRNYHALWLYRRIARVSSAVEAGRSTLETLLDELFAQGRRKVLIAGAADTGVPALAARAGLPYGIDMLVLDRCDTTLELNRRYFQRQSLPVRTLLKDLRDLDAAGEFDVVLAHSVLQVIPPDRRKDVLSRIARALRPDGRLLNVYNAGQRITGDLLPGYMSNYARWVVDELDRRGVPLPEPRDAFMAKLTEYAEERLTHEGAFRDADESDSLTEAAGFRIERRIELERPLSGPMLNFTSKLSRRRYVTVAAPR